MFFTRATACFERFIQAIRRHRGRQIVQIFKYDFFYFRQLQTMQILGKENIMDFSKEQLLKRRQKTKITNLLIDTVEIFKQNHQ